MPDFGYLSRFERDQKIRQRIISSLGSLRARALPLLPERGREQKMIKTYPEHLFDELKLLAKFPEESHLEGLKIHHSAGPEIIKSAKSLFNKGMISQIDGGYLTDSGREMVEHLHIVLDTLEQ